MWWRNGSAGSWRMLEVLPPTTGGRTAFRCTKSWYFPQKAAFWMTVEVCMVQGTSSAMLAPSHLNLGTLSTALSVVSEQQSGIFSSRLSSHITGKHSNIWNKGEKRANLRSHLHIETHQVLHVVLGGVGSLRPCMMQQDKSRTYKYLPNSFCPVRTDTSCHHINRC